LAAGDELDIFMGQCAYLFPYCSAFSDLWVTY
jgi:hypothetical protein